MESASVDTGLSPVRAGHELDTAALSAYLAQFSWFPRGSSVAVQQYSAGQSNPTYKLTVGSEAFVLRKKPHGKTLESAHAVEREFMVWALDLRWIDNYFFMIYWHYYYYYFHPTTSLSLFILIFLLSSTFFFFS